MWSNVAGKNTQPRCDTQVCVWSNVAGKNTQPRCDSQVCVWLNVAGKGCTALCIENMQRVQELSPIELVEMFVTVFCFLKDSSEVSQVLLDDFRAANGYVFLTEFLLKSVPFAPYHSVP